MSEDFYDPPLEDDALPGFDIRKANTEAWFDEWIEEQWTAHDRAQETVQISAEANPTSSPSAHESSTPFRKHRPDWHPETLIPGAVRLLVPDLARDDEELSSLPYVLILESWEPGWWLVAPFSRYEAPASVWEMLTGHEARPLQVIQAWNARTVPNQVLAQSWLVCMMDDAVTQDALKLTRAALTGRAEDAVNELGGKLGTGVTAPDDPRLAFFAEEKARYSPLTQAALQWETALQEEREQATETERLQTWRQSALPQMVLAAAAGRESRLPARSIPLSLLDLVQSLAELEAVPEGGTEFVCQVEADIRPPEPGETRWFGVFDLLDSAPALEDGTPFILVRLSTGIPTVAGSGVFERQRLRLQEGVPGLEQVPLSSLALLCATG